MCLEFVASRCSNRVLVVNVIRVCRLCGKRDSSQQAFCREEFAVSLTVLAAAFSPRIKVPKFNAQNGSLDGIKAAIRAEYLVVIALTAAVTAKDAKAISQFRIVGGHQTAISGCAQVLGR